MLKQFFGPLGVCRSPFQKNNFWGWGRLTRWLRRDTRENHRFWADFFENSNCSKSLIFWATPNLSRFLESSWALLSDPRTYRGVIQNNFLRWVENLMKVRKSWFCTRYLVPRSQRVNRPGRSKFFVLKQLLGPLEVCRSRFQKNNFRGWGRLTRSVPTYFVKIIDFWSKFLKLKFQ